MASGHVFMAMSLDGFVARTDHAIDWLEKQQTVGEDHGYDDFMASVDGLVMGSGSFKKVLTFQSWPYIKPVIVMSKSLTTDDVPQDLGGKVEISRLSPEELLLSLNQRGWGRAYVDGGRLVQSFIQAGLIKDMTVTIIPILIGDGLRMFGTLDRDVDLELVGSRAFESGLVTNEYRLLYGS